MREDGRAAADAVIEGLDEPRRSQMRHLHEVILDALPEIDVAVYDYSGKLIGYGGYDYSTSKGPAGRWFSIGIANRKSYVALYAMAGMPEGHYLVETMADRFPGMKIGRSCVNLTKPELVDDETVRFLARESWEQFKDGFHRPVRAKGS
ncbi:MAG: DUF1801 domain-containing protein [Chloroflexota bacterium]